MLDTHLYSHSARPTLHQAPTIRVHPDEVKALRQSESWGTMEPAPRRDPRPKSTVDWTLYAVAFLSLALTGAALGLTLVIGAAATYVTWPEVGSNLAAAAAPAAPIETPAQTPQGEAPAQAAAVAIPARAETVTKTRTTATRSRSTTPRRSITTSSKAPEQGSMSLAEYRRYLTEQANSRVARTAPTTDTAATPPAAAPAPQPTTATSSAPRSSARRTARARPTAPPAPAPVASPSSDDFYVQETIGADEDLMAAPSSSTSNGSQRVSGRLSQANNGVWILDDPLDPVAISIRTDGDAAIYVDGELIGGAPLAVVVELGSHEILVQSGTGTESFTVDAAQGDRICVSVKKGPKLTSCKKL